MLVISALRIQLSISTGSEWPHNAWQHHCKVLLLLLVLSLTDVSSAIEVSVLYQKQNLMKTVVSGLCYTGTAKA